MPSVELAGGQEGLHRQTSFARVCDGVVDMGTHRVGKHLTSAATRTPTQTRVDTAGGSEACGIQDGCGDVAGTCWLLHPPPQALHEL